MTHEPYELSPQQVGEMIGVHHDTIKRWAAAAKLPGVKLPGGHWRFRRSEVIEALERLRNDQTQAPAS